MDVVVNSVSPLPILLGGPSGVGKSTLGRFLSDRGCLFLEADIHGPDAIGPLGLRSVWDAFCEDLDPTPLAAELDRRGKDSNTNRVIIGLPSTPLTPDHLIKAKGALLVAFLTGPRDECMRSFVRREAAHALDKKPYERHWIANNSRLMEALETPAYRGHRIAAILEGGVRVAREELAQKLLEMRMP